MTKITRENFSQAMHEVVAERGEDFVYPHDWKWTDMNDNAVCQYYIEGVGPACIIGAALDKLGVDVSELELKDGVTNYEMNADEILKTRYGVKDKGLLVAASRAQRLQDRGQTWGQATESFDHTLAGVAEVK
jgi:hypothetical protein